MRAQFLTSGDLIADKRYRLGCALAERGDAAAAADLFAQALEIVPAFAPAWRELGRARRACGETAGAVEAFKECLRLDPEDVAGSSLELALLDAAPAPPAAPPAYVAALFNAYASEFDAALVDRLGYRGHDLVARAAGDGRYARVLDLGCGTGLTGALIRPRADYLEGVDLSPNMIRRARAKGVYDMLTCAPIEERLAGSEANFNLILAADVFCYVGALDAVFAGLARSLAAGGLAVFTVERSEMDDVVLRPSLRFAHSEAFLRRIAAQAGLQVAAASAAVARRDAGIDVQSLVIVLARR